MAISISEIRQVIQQKQPIVLGRRSCTLDEESLMNHGIIRGEPGCPVGAWTPWEDIFVAKWPWGDTLEPRIRDSGSPELDYYDFPSSSGVFSKRAIDLLMPCLDFCFTPLPCKVEGKPCFFLHTKMTIDALDQSQSEIIHSDHVVVLINRYAFFKDRLTDPIIFSIPEFRPILFATESVSGLIEKTHLTGFGFRCVDGPASRPESSKGV